MGLWRSQGYLAEFEFGDDNMKFYFFDAKTLGFLTVEDHEDVSPDLPTVTADEHDALINGQALGKRIAADDKGRPTLVDLPQPSPEQLAAEERAWRDTQLATTDGVVSRQRDELEEGSATTLSAAQYTELQAYRRLLRNWPEAGEFPLIEHRPTAPIWLADQFQ